MAEKKEFEFRIVDIMNNNYFEKIVKKAILSEYKKEIRDNYTILGFAKIQTGDWAVILERTPKWNFQEEDSKS